MRRLALLALTLLVVATGCAGRDFTRPQPESLVLGKTTEGEIRQRFGDPYREGTQIKNAETMKTLSYAYATGASSLAGGVIPSRGRAFYFWNGALVGHDFTSSFDEDKTDFDQSKVEQIKPGATSEARVIELFGKPRACTHTPSSRTKASGRSSTSTLRPRALPSISGSISSSS